MKEFVIDREKKIVFLITDDIKSISIDDLKLIKQHEKIGKGYRFRITNNKPQIENTLTKE